MSNNPGGISQSNSGSMGNGMQAAIGDNNRQRMESAKSTDEQSLTQSEVINLLAKIEEMIRTTPLPEDIKEDATTYLSAAKKATAKEEPKKDVAIVNLKSVAETLESASKTLDAGKNIWEKVQPILTQIAPWLGVAAKTFF